VKIKYLIIILAIFLGIVLAGSSSAKTEVIYTNIAVQGHTAINGDKVVWDEYHGHEQVYLKSLRTRNVVKIAEYGSNPDISGNRIVWMDWRKDSDPNIYLKDISTGKVIPICTNTAWQASPSINGNRVVWADERNGNMDIYMKDLATGKESAISTNSAWQGEPKISGNRVVWVDERTGQKQIYMRDLSTGITSRLCATSKKQDNPKISGNYVVWEDYRDTYWKYYNIQNIKVYLKNLKTGVIKQISIKNTNQEDPDINGAIVAYKCIYNGKRCLYAKNIATGQEFPVFYTTGTLYSPDVYQNMIVWAIFKNTNYIYLYTQN
jgi:beta propeller repeat protein